MLEVVFWSHNTFLWEFIDTELQFDGSFTIKSSMFSSISKDSEMIGEISEDGFSKKFYGF